MGQELNKSIQTKLVLTILLEKNAIVFLFAEWIFLSSSKSNGTELCLHNLCLQMTNCVCAVSYACARETNWTSRKWFMFHDATYMYLTHKLAVSILLHEFALSSRMSEITQMNLKYPSYWNWWSCEFTELNWIALTRQYSLKCLFVTKPMENSTWRSIESGGKGFQTWNTANAMQVAVVIPPGTHPTLFMEHSLHDTSEQNNLNVISYSEIQEIQEIGDSARSGRWIMNF